MECFGNFFYLDGNIYSSDAENNTRYGDVSFYEVIRTKNGIPLFFNDHIKRLGEGISTRYDPVDDLYMTVRKGLDILVRKEAYPEINIRVTITFTARQYSIHICYIPSSYPSEEMIRDGASLIFYHAERFDPGVKVLNARLRSTVNECLRRRSAYEALLVNQDGLITEGSRSNVFFITDSGLIKTAPDNMVLSGITRKYVTEIIRREGIELEYEAVRKEDIVNYRTVFITGTSPMVLPVRSIEDQKFDVSSTIVMRLRRIYTEMSDRSIRDYEMSKKED